MKKLICLVILIASCSTKQIQVKKPEVTLVKDLEGFFRRCEKDLENAKKVISDKDLVINLSHLQIMNAGGKKYYLLERENITKMIEAVTEGVYTDFILINKQGIIVYTKKNDTIFGRSINGSLKNTAIYRCYKNRKIKMNIDDVTEFPEGTGSYAIFISSKVTGKSSFPGIFILQVSTEQLKKLIKPNTEIIGADGLYKISHTNETGRKFPCMDAIPANNANQSPHFFTCNAIKYSAARFSYSNLSWFVIKQE